MKLIVGYHGKENFGDDIILAEFLSRNADAQFNLMTYSRQPQHSNINNQFIWTNSKLRNLVTFIIALFSSSEVIWVGGTCFSDQDGIGGYNYMRLAYLLGKKISYLYIGVNRITECRNIKRARRLLANSNRLVVRDQESFDNIHNICSRELSCTVKIENDLGHDFINNFAAKSISNSKDSMIVSWRDLSRYDNKFVCVEDLCKFINSVKEEYQQIVILNADEKVDKKVSCEIYSLLMKDNLDVVYLPKLDVYSKLEAIRDCKKIVTSRLHIAIAGNTLRKQTYVYEYSDKIAYQCQGDNYFIFTEKDIKNVVG